MLNFLKKNGKVDSRESFGSLSDLFRNLKSRRHLGFGRTIAILIDDQAIQMATTQKYWNRSRLLDATKIYIPPSHNTAERRKNFISGEIDRYIQEHRRLLTRFVLGVDGPETAVRVLSFPNMTARELARAVYWEGNKQIPFGLEDAYYGYQRANADSRKINSELEVSLIAASRSEVNNRLEELSPDLRISGVHFGLEAIGFMLRHVDGYSPDKTYILINIKKSNTEVSFYRGTRLEFKHLSSFGSGTLNTEIGGGDDFQVFTEKLAQEIQNTLDFYVGQFSRATTEIAFLYGDLSYSEEIISKLSARFGIEFRIFPIPNRLNPRPETESHPDQIPVALKAVALATVDDDLVDLSPPHLKEFRAIRKCHRLAIPALTLVTVLLLVTWMSLKYQVDKDRFLLASATAQIEEFSTSPAYIMYNKIKQRLAADRAFLDRLENEPTYLHLNLKEISRLTPQPIRLISYSLDNTGQGFSLSVEGRVQSTGMPPEVTLAEYIACLEGSPMFENVKLKKYIKKAEMDHFVIDFVIQTNAIL